MAAAGLLALIDDIATLLDDVATLSKVTVQKTSTVLADDLAVNAHQLTGVQAKRELPIVWAVVKGSVKNKCILVPAALILSAFANWLITPILILGGLYLCLEGFEKLFHGLAGWRQRGGESTSPLAELLTHQKIDPVEFEKDKIKGAIRTDFILSMEIVVIALGIVREADLATQFMVVSLIAAVITVGVYGIVAAIVKLDDAGLYLIRQQAGGRFGYLVERVGRVILAACPVLMKTLSVVGTAAMLMVGGGILLHNVPGGHHLFVWLNQTLLGAPAPSSGWDPFLGMVGGVIAGGAAFLLLKVSERLCGTVSKKCP